MQTSRASDLHPRRSSCGRPAVFLRGAAAASQHSQAALGALIRMETPTLQVALTRRPIKAAPSTRSSICSSVICCLRQTDGVSPPPVWARMWIFWTATLSNKSRKSRISHVLHRRPKTTSASSLGPSFGSSWARADS